MIVHSWPLQEFKGLHCSFQLAHSNLLSNHRIGVKIGWVEHLAFMGSSAVVIYQFDSQQCKSFSAIIAH